MVIVQAVRVGTELLTDVGIEQNVISNPDGDLPRFLNTAWTLQVSRGLIVAAILLGAAPFISAHYSVPVAAFIAISAAPFINSLTSTSILTLSRRLDARSRSIFEIVSECAGLLVNVALAIAMPTMWAPIIGLLAGLATRAGLSYFLPHPPHRLVFDRGYVHAILHFGKWIMLSSLGFYAAMYLDRLYLGAAVTMSVLGVYGLARAIADLPVILASRLASQIIFPVIAANRDRDNLAGLQELAVLRFRFLLLVALGVASVMAWSDGAIRLLYDSRYKEAGWMLFLLLINAWIGVLAFMAEASSLGHSNPRVVSIANILRVVTAAAALPTGFSLFGLAGAILALPLGELARYVVLHVVQPRPGDRRALLQDLKATLFLLGVLAAWSGVRAFVGLRQPWITN
jgi:O-antigen/teichoic acid export membrane protein